MSDRNPVVPGAKVQSLLTPEQIKRLVDARQCGSTLTDLALRFQVSRTFIREALRRHGVQ